MKLIELIFSHWEGHVIVWSYVVLITWALGYIVFEPAFSRYRELTTNIASLDILLCDLADSHEKLSICIDKMEADLKELRELSRIATMRPCG